MFPLTNSGPTIDLAVAIDNKLSSIPVETNKNPLIAYSNSSKFMVFNSENDCISNQKKMGKLTWL